VYRAGWKGDSAAAKNQAFYNIDKRKAQRWTLGLQKTKKMKESTTTSISKKKAESVGYILDNLTSIIQGVTFSIRVCTFPE
jgi:hypothetical protein